MVAWASFRHDATHRTFCGLNGGGFHAWYFIINCGSGAIFTLIKSCAFTWKFGKGWCFPGSTAVWMFNVCMSSTFHLKPVQLLAKLQMDLMVEITTLPKFVPISFTMHVDGLHGRPRYALGRHVDLIRFKLIGQFHQTFSMC